MICSAALQNKRTSTWFPDEKLYRVWARRSVPGMPEEAIKPGSRDAIPAKTSCVYFLVFNGAVIYVGETGCLLGRLTGHSSKVFHDVFYIPTPAEDRLTVEKTWIEHFRPKHNRPRQHVPISTKVHPDQVRKYRSAARREGLSLQDWMRNTLDREARP